MLIVDASVALKWVLEEEGSASARALFGAEDLLAPDFLLLECANVLATKTRRRDVSEAGAASALDLLRTGPVRFLPTAPYVLRAHALAVELGRSAYDCLYLAAALTEGGAMITADSRFAAAASAIPAYAARLRSL